jgi:hypothetical protein
MSENPHWKKFVALAIIVGFVASLITISQIVPWQPNQVTSSSMVTSEITNAVTIEALAAPIPLSPANGSVFNNCRTITLEWVPVSGAVTYSVEYDCYGCCAVGRWCSDVGNRYFVVNIKSPSDTLPSDWVGAQPSRWRVWAVDSSGHEGYKSDWWYFTCTA